MQKRGRGVDISSYKADDMEVVVMDDGVGGGTVPSKNLMGSEGRATTVSSFKDKLIGSNGGVGIYNTLVNWMLSSAADGPLWNGYDGWRWSDKREFSVGSAYSVLMGIGARVQNSKWREIWSLRVPQCVRVFMWLTTHRRHLKNVERVAVIKPEVLSQFYALPFEDWLHVNLHGFGIMAGISVDWNRDSVLPKGQRLIIECEEVFTSSRATLNHVVHDNTFWEGPEREDKRRWEDHARDANVVNQCSRRVDPGR
ncbi:hypothetical protein V6N13_028461 [Hibiscus sabdariffa]